jgi:hypothetical protein
LLVDAIEQEFVPLLVYNNRPGRDAELLENYRERSWNNPVVRFFTADGRELLARAEGVYAADAVAERLLAALAAAGRPRPGYLELAREELANEPLERAVFAMSCFWHGEGVLGSIAGVRSTRAGWLEEREVVEVEYSPARVPFAELLRRARTEGCAERVWVEGEERLAAAREIVGAAAQALATAPRPAKAGDHEYYLRESAYAWLPLTPLQRVRVNARLAGARAADDLLSPAQRALLVRVTEKSGELRGLEPPLDLAELWRYRAELEERLAGRGD